MVSDNNAGATTAVAREAFELRREGRLARIARALTAGETITSIAAAEGISRTLASREANSPPCRQLIADLVETEKDQLRDLFYLSLQVIEDAFSAKREYSTKDGQIFTGGPDHYARLAAAKHLRELIMAGRPAPKLPDDYGKPKMLSIEDIERLLNDRAEQASAQDDGSGEQSLTSQ